MKNLSLLLLAVTLLVSCGSSEESNVLEIDTKDIKGTINANPDKTGDLNHHGNGLESEGKTLDFKEKGEISIYLVKEDLATTESQLTNSSLFDKVEIIDKGDNYISFYTEKKGFGDKEDVKGYGFKVIKPYGDGTFVCLNGQGTEMFTPITTKEINKELLDIALTFKKK